MILSARAIGAHVAGPPPRWLFRDLDLSVTAGEIWAVVGPNGSGKSTLLRMLAGVAPPPHGQVELAGQPLARMPRRARAQTLAYLPQLTPLYHDLTVRQLVMLGRAPHRSRWRGPDGEDRRRVDEALARVEAHALADRSLSTLSGGERQRVMLARLLATGARVLVLDEPTTALDIGHALRLLGLCRSLAADGTAVVLALHELDLARRYADFAVCLRGDNQGQHTRGSAHEALDPQVLGDVFNVDVRQHPGGLSFHDPNTRDR